MMICLKSETLQLVGNMAIKVEEDSRNVENASHSPREIAKASMMETASSSGVSSDLSDTGIASDKHLANIVKKEQELTTSHSNLISNEEKKENNSLNLMLKSLPSHSNNKSFPMISSKLNNGVQNPADSFKCGRTASPGVQSIGAESETSDYPRSTPSPGESESSTSEHNKIEQSLKTDYHLDSPNSKDQGFGDELVSSSNEYEPVKPIDTTETLEIPSKSTKLLIKDKPDFISSVEQECKFSLMAAISNSQLSLQERLALIRDPKIMRSRTAVVLRKLPELDDILNVSNGLSGVKVSPSRDGIGSKRKNSGQERDCWFAKRSKISRNLTVSPEEKKVNTSPVQLIRPAVLKNVPSQDQVQSSKASGKFSGFSENNNGSNNPFLPPSKSPYLFGFTDDFEYAPSEELMETEEEEEEEEEELEQGEAELEEQKPVPKVCEIPEPLKKPVSQELGESSSSLNTFQSQFKSPFSPKSIQQSTTTNNNKSDLINIIRSNGTNNSQVQNQVSQKLRFPAVQELKNMIECKWKDCQMAFKTHGKLSDHLKASHVINQVQTLQLKKNQRSPKEDDQKMYYCLWEGCKVYGKKSLSQSWLEKHVPTHGGKFAFACIVSGCKMRFSSQKTLQRHVNGHFNKNSNSSSGSSKAVSKKSGAEQSESTKNLKRAGVKLKYRKTVFSARIFDFFDPGIMAGIKEGLYKQRQNKTLIDGQEMEFKSKIMVLKRDLDGSRKALVKWIPENFLDDEWLKIEEIPVKKSVKISHLSEASKQKFREEMFTTKTTSCNQQKVCGSKKRKNYR